MATVKYHGEFPEGRDEIIQHGYTFERGKSVSVTDKHVLARFAANRFFDVSGESDKEDVKQGQEEAEKAEIQGLHAYLQDAGIYAHHKLGVAKLRELKAEHEKTQAKALED